MITVDIQTHRDPIMLMPGEPITVDSPFKREFESMSFAIIYYLGYKQYFGADDPHTTIVILDHDGYIVPEATIRRWIETAQRSDLALARGAM